MPELSDVEGFRRVLAEHAVGKPIDDVDVADAQVLRGFSAKRLRELLRGRSFAEPSRRGKWLIAPVSGADEAHLLVHFGMTGALVWAERGQQRHQHDRVAVRMDGGELRYRDMRKLKGLYLAGDADDVAEQLGELGPDAFDVSAAQLYGRLGERSAQLKSALSDQSVLAGLGNLLVDEILWQARFNPRTRATELTEQRFTSLHKTMRTVLRQSAKAGRVPPWPSWLTGHRDDPSGECPRCGTRLSHGRISSRTTVWCPHCQGA